MNNINILKKDLIAILVCFGIVFSFCLGYFFLVKASPEAKVRFTTDAILSLTGLSDGDLYIAQNSECDQLTVSGSTLTVSGIPDGSNFILKTPQHNNALKLTPSGGTIGLTFSSSNLATSTGNISQWTLDGSGSTRVAHIVGTPKANTWYAIKVDNVLFNSFQSNASGEVTFTYDGGFSSKVFTIEEDTTAPTEFDLVSPVNNYSTSDNTPTFSWNPSDVPDLDHYALYINGNLNTDNISGTSVTLTSALSCGSHTWYVKAVDKAGNSTQSASTFTINIVCGGAGPILPPVSITGQGNVYQNLGGEVRKTFESGELAKVVFPSYSIKGTVVVRIEPKNKTEIVKNNPLPKNTQIVGDLVADFRALSGGKELEKFVEVVPITFTYSDEQVKEAGVNEKTLKIYWWDKSTKTWKPLKSEANTLTNIITAYTIHFTLFAVMGETKEKPVEEAPAIAYKGIPAEFTFEKNLGYGMSNNDVKNLQIILKIETSETYPADVPATGWFGPITKASVIAFQEKYPDDILTPWGLTEGTGYVGSTTRAKLNSLLVAIPTEKEVAPEIPPGYQSTTNLQYGQTGNEVRYLQIFLKAQGPEIYPEGLVTGNFLSLTKAAVIRFQEKYASDILTPWGLTEGTGFVGKTTRAKINEILRR